MRLRLVPWIWGHIQPSSPTSYSYFSDPKIMWHFASTMRILRQNNYLAHVKYLRVLLCPWVTLIHDLSRFMTIHYLGPRCGNQFVKCLGSLPNLHMLEIGSPKDGCSDPWLLEGALGRWVVFPQIKTLIIPESTYPLLKHCPNVEDVVWVITDKKITSDAFLRSLPPSSRSKVKRLTIPLVLPCNPSRK